MDWSLENVRKTAREVVAERGPDFVYTNDEDTECFYVRLGELPDGVRISAGEVLENDPRALTGCIVGEIARRNGADMEYLATCEDMVVNSQVRRVLGLTGHDETANQVIYYLRTLQIRQDAGEPWGVALRDAESTLPEHIRNSTSIEGEEPKL